MRDPVFWLLFKGLFLHPGLSKPLPLPLDTSLSLCTGWVSRVETGRACRAGTGCLLRLHPIVQTVLMTAMLGPPTPCPLPCNSAMPSNWARPATCFGHWDTSRHDEVRRRKRICAGVFAPALPLSRGHTWASLLDTAAMPVVPAETSCAGGDQRNHLPVLSSVNGWTCELNNAYCLNH